MHSSEYLALFLTASLAAAAPAAVPNQFPINDGFPTPNDQQVEKIERGARGTLPDYPIPKFHRDTYKSLQLIATNEMVEVSLYEKCLLKIKNGAPGFGPENFVNEEHRQFVISTFEVFYQQEEIHTLIGQGGLQANGQQPVLPSQYQFKIDTYQDCLTSANILGDNVLGTSQGVINQAIAAGDSGLAAQLDALIAQEGQQSGFLRSEMLVNGKHNRIPAAMPGYTASTREFLFSLLETMFIKPGTDENKIDIPVFLSMNVQNTAPIDPVDQTLKFTVDLNTTTGNNYKFPPNVNWDTKNLYVAYISGLNMPFFEPIKNVKFTKTTPMLMTFDAKFPAYTNIINGFAIAALTSGNSSTNPQEVTSNTLAGPATIELSN